MRKRYYHRTIVIKDVFSGVFPYTLLVMAVCAVLILLAGRLDISPDRTVVINAFERIVAVKEVKLFSRKNIYDIFSEIVPLVKSSDEMMKKYEALYGGVKKETKETKQGFLIGKTVEEIDMSVSGIGFNNQTTYPINLKELRNTPLEFSAPCVLIVHTHTSESYAEAENARSYDENMNMIRIGTIIADELRKNGIKVIHDKTQNDYPVYNGSYNKALGVIERNIKEHPDIQVVLDIHRDYTARTVNGEEVQLKPVGEVNGEKCAQVMFVVGTDNSGLTHPHWRKNLTFAVKINEELDKISENIARNINVRKQRFNQHMTNGSLIIEVGSASNSLRESENAAHFIGKAITEVLKKY